MDETGSTLLDSLLTLSFDEFQYERDVPQIQAFLRKMTDTPEEKVLVSVSVSFALFPAALLVRAHVTCSRFAKRLRVLC